jgi:peptidoglycan/xylan/chitin deacetylase (PgdA/CDA1 family)
MMEVLRIVLASLLALVLAACASVPEGPAPKRIALTFDDTPRHPGQFLSEDERTRLLIKALEDTGVEQAVFFINPGKITERQGAEKRIAAYVEAGHVLANHTADHLQLSRTDADEYIANIDAAAQWMQGLEGVRPWFRYPYLDEGQGDIAKRDRIRQALAQRQLLNASPSVGASDWWMDDALNAAKREGKPLNLKAAGALFVTEHVKAAAFYDDLARKTYGRPIAHNMLLHETDLSALFVADLVVALRQDGWTIITGDEAYEDAALLNLPNVSNAHGTLVQLAAQEKGISGPLTYPGSNTQRLREQFDAKVLGLRSRSKNPE